MRTWCRILLSSLLASPALAQETRGNISGTVRDAQGVIPGATVTIAATANANTFANQVFPVIDPGGAHRIYLVFRPVAGGPGNNFFNLNWVEFGGQGPAPPLACAIQGVGVCPGRRGTGSAGSGMAVVVVFDRHDIEPLVPLYVNDYNIAARAAYQRVGFREVDTFATILF